MLDWILGLDVAALFFDWLLAWHADCEADAFSFDWLCDWLLSLCESFPLPWLLDCVIFGSISALAFTALTVVWNSVMILVVNLAPSADIRAWSPAVFSRRCFKAPASLTIWTKNRQQSYWVDSRHGMNRTTVLEDQSRHSVFEVCRFSCCLNSDRLLRSKNKHQSWNQISKLSLLESRRRTIHGTYFSAVLETQRPSHAASSSISMSKMADLWRCSKGIVDGYGTRSTYQYTKADL